MDFDVAPSQQTRQRQRLVAMAAVRTREEAEPAEPAEPGRHRLEQSSPGSDRIDARSRLLTRLRGVRTGRRLTAALAAFSVVVATLSVLAVFAQSAIPGDTLYALKRGTEQVRLAVAGSPQDEGRLLFGYASNRVDELVQLLNEPVAMSVTGSGVQAADAGSVADLLIATMETMDRQTTDGANALTTSAVDEESLPTLQFIGEWGVDQWGALDGLAAKMPNDARTRAELSKDLLLELLQRLDGLAQVIDCNDCQGEAAPSTDALGPIPCSDCDSDPSAKPTSQSSSSPGQSDPPPGQSSPPTSTSPGQSSQPPGDSGGPGVPVPPVDPSVDPTVEPPVEPPVDPPIPPVPPAEGSACVTLGGLAGIIQGGVCVAIPIVPPPDPNEGQPCVLVDLPWPLDDIMGIIDEFGVCVPLGG